MSQRPPESVEFKPIRLGRRRRSTDPVAVGLAVLAAALVIAVIKPWEAGRPAATAVASPTIQASGTEPGPSPASIEPLPPTWVDIAQVISRHEEWGIRAVVLGSTPNGSSSASPRYAEHWVAVDVDAATDATATVDPGDDAVVAMGVTFPRTEAPLAVRIWLDHGERDLEWIAARPVNEVPGRGAYLFLRGSEAQTAALPWEPGRYRVDVLVGEDIRRISVDILDRSGVLPDPEPLVRVIPRTVPLSVSGLAGLRVGLFASSDGDPVGLPSTAGPALDETAAWLDLDRQATDLPPRAFVARTYQPRATRLGVVLPPASTIRSAALQRLAPFGASADIGGETTTGSGDTVSYVAFSTPRGAIWNPGVYALRVEWVDGEGAHDLTWHVEIRPGVVQTEPALLTATRAWARLAGSSGVLMGWTEPIDGGSAGAPIGSVDMGPEPGTLYAILHRSNVLGCGDSVIPGGATVVGFLGPAAADLAPVTSTIQFPLADSGPLPVLTAARTVPGLAIAAPVLTAEFGGPAAYGFRAGSSPTAPGYTICVGFAAPTP